MEVAWSCLDWPGVEHVRWSDQDGLRVDSNAVMAFPDGAARIAYRIEAAPDGATTWVEVELVREHAVRRIAVSGDGLGAWRDESGAPLPELAGCLDVDISITPFTNTLPIRRLGLRPGQAADLRVLYIKLPELELSVSPQRYTRLDAAGGGERYRYESPGFRADLPVDEHDLVLDYPEGWRRERT
ncbi:putative glycolipid-binding domain-containing protein [Amycolatopsis aidingensis]|uniref:putative glycolipid-binding domain-containing protein n=1 Tax=Amycolatopsis aidingensis TaxID=2842453 RepID=UPI001C0C4BE2|nr:putative glycolipid-binding domain-containing protein [Amycolatopsis aidingensis]